MFIVYASTKSGLSTLKPGKQFRTVLTHAYASLCVFTHVYVRLVQGYAIVCLVFVCLSLGIIELLKCEFIAIYRVKVYVSRQSRHNLNL